MTKQILITCDPEKRLLRIPLEHLNELQGDLKEMSREDYEKFRALVIKDGINFAMHVWKEMFPIDDDLKAFKWWIIDGTGRKRMLTTMRDMDGFTVPPLPCVEIFAANIDDAKLQILSASSSFHKMTHQGLYEFTQGINLPPANLIKNYSLPHVNLPKYMEEFHVEPKSAEGEDDVPSVPIKADCRLGDLFLLGSHRLLCGDSTDASQVARLMNGEKADMVFTDPPYGVSYTDSLGRSIQNDELTDEKLQKFLSQAFAAAFSVTLIDAAWFVWHASRYQREFESALEETNIKVRQQIIWVKGEGHEGTSRISAPAIGRSHFRWLHEPCFYATAGKPFNKGDRTTTTVWTVTRPTTGSIHPTQKPVPLIEIALANSCPGNGLVLDPFLGSGSTLIACEKTNRKCYGMEIDPLYCDVILDRWAKFTGKEPKREDGTPWSSIKNGGH